MDLGLERVGCDVMRSFRAVKWTRLIGGCLGALASTVGLADVVTLWNAELLAAIRTEDVSPTMAARSLAILHVAIYDAVHAVDATYLPYYVNVAAPPGTSAEVAAVSAAHDVLQYLYPSEGARYDAMLEAFLSGYPVGASRDAGVRIGNQVAEKVLQWRSNDGATTTVPYVPNPSPGHWRRTPPFFRPPDSPQCPFVMPFAMLRGNQFRPPGPLALASARYAADLLQVRSYGASNSPVRTTEQTEIAWFWSDFSYTVTPPGHWNSIAEVIVERQGLSLVESARLFALLNITMADSGILCWDAKYAFDFWRPVTAIRAADTDGNSATVADPTWNSLLTVPSFPEYTSGHSTFSSAGAAVLALYFGTDLIPFSIGCDALPGVERSYLSLAAAADECGMSRIYGGIHFFFSKEDGKRSGEALASYVMQNFLLPVSSIPRMAALRSADSTQALLLHGLPGSVYRTEASTDLLRWFPISTNQAELRGALVDDPTAGDPSIRFYRTAALIDR